MFVVDDFVDSFYKEENHRTLRKSPILKQYNKHDVTLNGKATILCLRQTENYEKPSPQSIRCVTFPQDTLSLYTSKS